MRPRSATKPNPNQIGFDFFDSETPQSLPAGQVEAPKDIPRVLGPSSLTEVGLIRRYVAMKQLNKASSNQAGTQHNHIEDPQLYRRTKKKAQKRIKIAVNAYLASEIATELDEEGKTLGQALAEHAKGEVTKGATLAHLIMDEETAVDELPYFQSDEMKVRLAGTRNFIVKRFARQEDDSSDMVRLKADRRDTIIKQVKKEAKQYSLQLPAIE